MRIRTSLLAILAVLLPAAGCRPAAPAFRATQDPQFDAMWSAANQVLREYRFSIDRADKRAGVITTFPLLSRHGFEFWRKDAVTARDKLEATLHTVYRQARLTIRRGDPAGTPARPPGRYVVDVAVGVTRSNKPTLQVTGAADAHDLFFEPGELGRAYAMADRAGPKESEKADLGRDKNLEQVLQQRIHRLAARLTPVAATAPAK